MRRLILLTALVVASCGGAAEGTAGPTSAPTATTSSPTAQPTAGSTATAAASTAGDVDATVAHIVGAIDELDAIVKAGDENVGDQASSWIATEGEWLGANLQPTDVARDELQAYVDAMLEALEKVRDGDDFTDQVATIIAMRGDIAALAPDAVAAVPTPEPTKTVPKVPGTVTLTDENGTATVKVDKVGTYKTSFGVPCDLGKCLTIRTTITGTAGEDMEWGPFDFTIVSADGDVYEVTGLYKEPSLPYDAKISKGEKVRGWLTFDVPKSLKHGVIHVGGDGGAEIKF